MKFAHKKDLLIVAGVLILSAIIWIISHHSSRGAGSNNSRLDNTVLAELYYGSQLVEVISLSKEEERTFTIPQKPHVLLHISGDGKIRFEESDCPDQICVRTGWIAHVGESAACLPNAVIVKLVPKNKESTSRLDMVVG